MKCKTIALLILSIIGFMFIGIIIVIRLIVPFPLSKDATTKDFIKNQDNILLVTDYLMHSSYDEIYINDTDQSGIMFAGLENGDVHVNNMKVVNAMDTLLKKRGYSIIDKDNNTILFQRSTRGADFGSGIAYSMDSKKPNIDYLTLLEPLEKSNWYYYEADFAKWKKINGNQ